MLPWLLVLVGSARERVAVVSFLEGSGERVTTSVIYDAVAGAIRLRPTLELVSREELFVGDPDREERIEDCGTGAVCLSERLAPFTARYGLLVVVGFDADPPILGLRLVDTRAQKIIESVSISTPDPIAEIPLRAGELFDRAGHPRWSVLVVSTTPGALVHVSGAVTPAARGPELLLPAGRYRVTASLEGYSDEEADVDLLPGVRSELALEMERLPPPAVWETWWFWTIVGGVAVAAAATTAAIVSTRGEEICIGNRMALEGCSE